MMTIHDLLKNLTDNLTDEQKQMDACFLDSNGNIYDIDAIMTLAVSEQPELPDGQTIFASLGTAAED
jgi:hypothetical protein